MGIVLTALGGLAMFGVAMLDAHWGNPGAPVWLFVGTCVVGVALMVVLPE